MKKITINDLHIVYAEAGWGRKSIILIHGWGQSHAFWTDLMKQLEDRYHVYVLDLPGFGLSQEPQSIWQIDDYVEFLHTFVKKLHITTPSVIGHSFGGRVALLYASKYPTEKLVVYSSGAGLPEKSFYKNFHRYIVVRFGKYLIPNVLYHFHTKAFKPINYENQIIIERSRSRRMLDIYSQQPQDLQEALKKIKVKTLIISGAKDYIASPNIGRLLHKVIKGSTLVEIPNATHFAHIELPKIFYRSLREFLDNK